MIAKTSFGWISTCSTARNRSESFTYGDGSVTEVLKLLAGPLPYWTESQLYPPSHSRRW